jgi:hypothetical protein
LRMGMIMIAYPGDEEALGRGEAVNDALAVGMLLECLGESLERDLCRRKPGHGLSQAPISAV